jgi:Bifunctional DNA primase/polymerase, N-terminal/Primase C terminal 1 (PriCT-1)
VSAADFAALLERCGREYGRLGLAIAFTDGLAGDKAKRITAKGWPKTARLPDAEFGAAFLLGRGRRRNPAVVLGASGLVGFDVDGQQAADRLRRMALDLPATVSVRTGRGVHLWYRVPEGAPSGVVKVEVAADGLTVSRDGYLIAPPAVHPSGLVYAFAEGLAPWEVELAELPRATVERVAGEDRRQRARETVSDGPIPAGRRHAHLRRIAGAMRRVGASRAAVEAALIAENLTCCQPPKDEQAVRALAEDAAARWHPEQEAS